jgi:peptidoglycan/LPS O-acetylase OafA/YrhL
VNRETSIYLDLVRFTAALVVFASHFGTTKLTGGLFWQFQPYGPPAVAVFFVLSGFVIGFVTDQRETAGLVYGVSRAARIYSVALPALVATFVLDRLGHLANPAVYEVLRDSPPEAVQFISGLFFCNELWYNHIIIGSNSAYWSLGYEVWYYIIFGLAAFGPARWRWGLVALACAIAGPKILTELPLWLMGLGAYRLCARGSIGLAAGLVLCLGSMALWGSYEAAAALWGRPFDVLDFRQNLMQNYVIGTLFAIHIVGFSACARLIGPVLATMERPIRWLAGATLTIYLFHQPVGYLLAAISPAPASSAVNRVIVFGGTAVCLLLIAQLTERRKDSWRRGIMRVATMAVGPRAAKRPVRSPT